MSELTSEQRERWRGLAERSSLGVDWSGVVVDLLDALEEDERRIHSLTRDCAAYAEAHVRDLERLAEAEQERDTAVAIVGKCARVLDHLEPAIHTLRMVGDVAEQVRHFIGDYQGNAHWREILADKDPS